ncbi:hypothetical protein [Halomonas huangheensis]|uniref:YtkA-like domain-containing protein n=1 Tax=Halomonas huangheensis TaxID=1178482 RepID=W1N3T2_9GAMM|nr:hypothetical protein [Halomonas huangheensis]ALM51669.1 hypothetical protein AR456_04750 [Halomonas huangheensis]ERL50159.1 hypothetical protein BJB45_03265 [Halomonas huangheensis]
MNMKTVFKTMIIAISMSMAASVSASMGASAGQAERLERGISNTQILSLKTPKRYELEVDRSTMLRLSSEQPAGEPSNSSFIKATLYDDSGRSIAQSSSYQGELYLSRQLQPGAYELEVSGWTPAGKSEGLSNRYELHVDY